MLLASITLIVNQMLISSMWYFIALWVGLQKVLWKVKDLLCNYLWFGFENMVRSRVSKHDYKYHRKLEVLVSHSRRMLWQHSRVTGSFKHLSLASWICKFWWGIASRNCNFLDMVYEVHHLFGCYPYFICQMRVKSLASYCSILKGDGVHGYFSFHVMFRGYFAT